MLNTIGKFVSKIRKSTNTCKNGPLIYTEEYYTRPLPMYVLQLKDITATEARSSKPVVVAVLDTGIFRDHPDLKDIVRESKNFVKDVPGSKHLCTLFKRYDFFAEAN